MNAGYASDESMSNSLLSEGSEFSSTETVILLGQSSSSDVEESDGNQVEAPTSSEDTHSANCASSADPPAAGLETGAVHFGGYSYARDYFNVRTDTNHYRCSAYRRTKCKAKLFVRPLGTTQTGEHMHDCVPGFYRIPTGPAPPINDRKEEMLLVTDKICVRDVTLTPTEVWRMVRDQFYGTENEIVRRATKKQVLGRLYRTRAKLFGRETFGRLEREPLCDVKETAGSSTSM
ncbi:hypothetical protein ON010_g5827 [Phytophthora cinnamomi]|nr:hypothetical protein ON010_g5827 [Phytophthora cinnamomi]